MIRNSWNVGKIQRMRKQCVPGLPSPCGRPGNEATPKCPLFGGSTVYIHTYFSERAVIESEDFALLLGFHGVNFGGRLEIERLGFL